MAQLVAINITKTSITVECQDLQHNPGDYDAFRYLTTALPPETGFVESSSSQFTVTGLNPNTTYDFYAEAKWDGVWYEVGGVFVTTLPEPITRPNNWSWFTTKTQGSDFKLTASEWNSFTTRINDFRNYKNQGAYSFTNAITGNKFLASIFNEARSAINAMNPPTSVPSSVSAGDDVTAFGLNRLRDSLNSIS